MNWFKLSRLAQPRRLSPQVVPDAALDTARMAALPDSLAFGSPGINTNTKPIQRSSPDIVDIALDGPAGLGIVPSPIDSSKPGNHPPKSKSDKRRSRKRRLPRPNLSEGPKLPTGGGTGFRPDGDLPG